MSERMLGLVVPLLDPHWVRAMRRGRDARLAPGLEPIFDPFVLLARHIQLDLMRGRSGEQVDERWTRELGHELGRARSWDWRFGPSIDIEVETTTRSNPARLLRLGRDFVDISPQPWIEPGGAVLLVREDPQGHGTVWIGARCRDSNFERTRLEPSAAAIIRAHTPSC